MVDPVAEGGGGWNIYSVQQTFDTSTSAGWFASAQCALFGDVERRVIGERTSAALAQLRKEGKHTGRRSDIPTEVEDRIAALHAEGMSASAIATLLEAEGVPRPTARSKAWHHSHVIAPVRRTKVRNLVGV